MRIAEENNFRYRIGMLLLSVIFMAAATTTNAKSIVTRIGKLDLKLGLPTKTSVEKLYDEIDFQRACQAFLWALPAVGVSG